MTQTLRAPVVPSWVAEIDRGGSLTIHDPDSQLERASAGDVTVWFDGYLYGQDRLASELSLHSHASQSELLVAAYHRWGSSLFEHLDGGFVAIVSTSSTGETLFSRDPLGKHPLFYAECSARTVLGANVLLVAERSGRRNEIDAVTLTLRLLTLWPGTGQTFFNDVSRVPPAGTLSFAGSHRPVVAQYWLPIPDDDEPFIGGVEVAERIEAALQQAVDDALALGVNGLMLSGGLDSVSVGVLARRSGGSLLACCGKDLAGVDPTYEAIMQDAACDALGLRQLVGRPDGWLDGQGLLEATLDLVPSQPSPTNIFWTASYVGFYRQAAAAGAPFLLTGSGGDEWLGVHPAWLVDLLRSRRFSDAKTFSAALAGTGGLSWSGVARRVLPSELLMPLAQGALQRTAPRSRRRLLDNRYWKRTPPWLSVADDVKSGVLDWVEARRIEPLPNGSMPRSSYRHTTRELWHSNPYHSYELERRHHVGAMAGVRLLSPFQAKPVVDLLNRVDPGHLLDDERTKGPLRKIVERSVPELGIGSQRKWYDPSVETFVERSLRTELADAYAATGCRVLAKAGLVDEAAFARSVEAAPELSLLERARIFTVLSTERWLAAQASEVGALTIGQ